MAFDLLGKQMGCIRYISVPFLFKIINDLGLLPLSTPLGGPLHDRHRIPWTSREETPVTGSPPGAIFLPGSSDRVCSRLDPDQIGSKTAFQRGIRVG